MPVPPDGAPAATYSRCAPLVVPPNAGPRALDYCQGAGRGSKLVASHSPLRCLPRACLPLAVCRWFMRFTPKLSFASAGGKPKFRISDWQRIELAYGHPLANSVRRKIRAATREFLDWAVFERTATNSSEAIARVQSIKKAAHEFREVVFRCPQKIGKGADFVARHLISKHSGLLFNKGRDGLQNLALDLAEVISNGCDFSLAELRDETKSGFRKGDAWDSWVRKLTAILDAHQLPTENRKDTDKNKTGRPSKFVAFLRELQACTPVEDRRSEPRSDDFQANIALSAAIDRARRVSKTSSGLSG